MEETREHEEHSGNSNKKKRFIQQQLSFISYNFPFYRGTRIEKMERGEALK